MVRWLRWHCPPDTGFEIRAVAVWGRARYLLVTEVPHNTDFHTWMGKKLFNFFQTAETGNRTPNSGVKGSGANHYPRAPAQVTKELKDIWRICHISQYRHTLPSTIVFKVNRSNSVKIVAKSAQARTLERWRVSNECKIPSNWRIFLRKQWENMIIDINRRFHQQPHDRPRWISLLYSWGGGHDDLLTYELCDKRRRPWGSPDGKS